MTILWSSTKDFKQALRYKSKDLIKTQNLSFSKHLASIILSKLAYYSLFIVAPLVLSNAPWYLIISGLITMHLICGLVLAAIFQPAHVVPTSDYPQPDSTGNVDTDWAISQLYNTTNFAPKHPIFTWYVGGLNYQV